MLKNLLKIIFPFIVVFAAFRFFGAWVGLAAFILLLAYLIYSNLPDIYLLLGKYHYMKDNAKALSFLEKAYNTDRLKTEGKLYYAYVCMREGDFDRAERLFNAILAYKREPALMAQARLNYAILLWKKGNLDEALEITENVYETYKSSVLYGNYGYLLLMKGDLEKALKINLEAYEYNDTDGVICDNLGQNYYLLGEYEKSREIFEKLMELEPKFPIPYYNYAKTLYVLGEKEAAAENLKIALGCPFSAVAEISKDEVEAFLRKIESEL